MNNILTFEDYKKMNIRQVESVIYRQFIEEIIKEEEKVNEGFIRDRINISAGKFIQNALAEEIEKGKELEKSIKEALDSLNEGVNEIGKTISDGDKTSKDSDSNIAKLEKIKEAIKAVQSQTFDTLTMIGSEGEIDFAGFLGSATVSAVANFGILFSPIRSVFITRKAYKYFLGIIKQTIRRNLLVIQLNFDQFENLIIQKSFETEEDSEFISKLSTMQDVLGQLTSELCGESSKFLTKKDRDAVGKKIDAKRKEIEANYRYHTETSKHNPLSSLWQDQHNNTYTRTLEQIKQYINDDSQKELDALKNSITKMAGNDPDLLPYGELLISAAEEYAINTCYGINNNFIKMSSVFNLENQKKLIELIKNAHENDISEVKGKTEEGLKDVKDTVKDEEEKGKKIYEELMKSDVESYTIESFNEKYNADDLKALRAFLSSEEGKEPYKKLLERNIIFKYILLLNGALNMLLDSFNELEVVEITKVDDFYDTIAKEDQALYYMMADRSLKDAFVTDDEKKLYNSDYFGFDIPSDMVEKNTLLFESYYGSPLLELINEKKSKWSHGFQKEYGVRGGQRKIEEVREKIEKLKTQLSDIKQKDNEKNKEEIEKLEYLLNNANKMFNSFMDYKTIDGLKALETAIEELKKKMNEYNNLDEDGHSDSDIDDSDSDSDNGGSDIEDEGGSDIEDEGGSDIEDEGGSDIEDEGGSDTDKPKSVSDLLFPDGEEIKKYFLKVKGDGEDIFNILHKDFKTEIFEGDEYLKEISTDSKLTIFKIFFENLKIGEDVAEEFSKHLVALEAHMLLNPKDSWFVVKNNTELIEKEQCFNKDSEQIVNNKAFVEISQDEYKKIKDFLTEFGKKINVNSNQEEDK